MINLSPKKLAFYGLVLAAALIGLVIDRADSASAAPTSPLSAALSKAAGDEPADKDPDMIGPTIAAVFGNRAPAGDMTEAAPSQEDITPIRDAFSLSRRMQAHYESSGHGTLQQQETQAAEQEKIDREDAAAFKEAHVLKGTFIRPPDIWAVIDDLIMRAGDDLDGFVLRKIDHYRVVFEKGDNPIVLELPDAPGSQGPK
jgi:hypothetical protein